MLLTLVRCAPDRNKEKSDTYFDINGLVDEQINLLISSGPSVLKKALINGKEESIRIEPNDSSSWAKELVIFKVLDLNRSRLSDSYIVSESSSPEKTVIMYESKFPKDTEVEKITIELGRKNQPLRISATLNNQNQLFSSAKTFEMKFKDIKGQRLLTSYQTQGGQKMISKDSTSYVINAKIIF